MSSYIARVEIYGDKEEGYYFSCQELDLMGYASIEILIDDIENKLKEKQNEN